jgi:hypothetical protein
MPNALNESSAATARFCLATQGWSLEAEEDE